jgi:hypothetical protein
MHVCPRCSVRGRRPGRTAHLCTWGFVLRPVFTSLRLFLPVVFLLWKSGCGLVSLPEDLWGSAPDSDPAPGGGPFFLSPPLLLFHLLLFCSREDEEERR